MKNIDVLTRLNGGFVARQTTIKTLVKDMWGWKATIKALLD